MKILFTAFYGKNNSSRILINNIDPKIGDKLALKNSFVTSVKELIKYIDTEDYDLIVSFGQRPIGKNKIFLELTATYQGKSYKTDFNYDLLFEKLKINGYDVKKSNDCGDWYCNYLYYEGLKYIKENNKNISMIFIHLPKIKNIDSISKLTRVMNDYFSSF